MTSDATVTLGSETPNSNEEIWYVAYGSNMLKENLARILRRNIKIGDSKAIEVPYRVFYAGNSKKWNAGVAFMSPYQTGHRSKCVAYKITREELATIYRIENGAKARLPDISDLEVGDWKAALLPFDTKEGFQGKYNTLLKLDDIRNCPAYTITSTRNLVKRDPSSEYLAQTTEALTAISKNAGEFIQDEGEDSSPGNASREISGPLQSSKGYEWSGPYEKHDYLLNGVPSIQLPRNLAPYESTFSVQAKIKSDGIAPYVTVNFSLNDNQPARLPSILLPDDAPRIGKLTLFIPPIVEITPSAGKLGDISKNDVVQVDPNTAKRLGKWALLSSAEFTGPVEIKAREHVPINGARIAYAQRTLFGVTRHSNISLQPLVQASHERTRGFASTAQGKPSWKRWVPSRANLKQIWNSRRTILANFEQTWGQRKNRLFNKCGKFILRSPALALRATEGLLGDDAHLVVRVDSTTLDYVGVNSGGLVWVSWGEKLVKARVLLQTPETAQAMELQLQQATGLQERRTLGNIMSRRKIPVHMRIWVSARVRFALQMPPDSVVRIQRSTGNYIFRGLTSALLPITAMIVGFANKPSLWWIWIIVGILVAILSLLPHRLPDHLD